MTNELLEKLQTFARECCWWALVDDCNSAMDGDEDALKKCSEINAIVGVAL